MEEIEMAHFESEILTVDGSVAREVVGTRLVSARIISAVVAIALGDDHHLGGRQATAGKYLGDHELDETHRLEGQFLAAGGHVVGVVADAALNSHAAVIGHDVEALLEEIVVVLVPEVFEGLDGHDPVDGVAEIFPAVQQHLT